MIRRVLFFLAFCFVPVVLFAKPDSVKINGQTSGSIVTRGEQFSWEIFLSGIGESVTNEIWIDLNRNERIDEDSDLLFARLYQTDGMTENGENILPDMDGSANGVIYFSIKIALAVGDYIMLAKSGTDSAQATSKFVEMDDDSCTYTISGRVTYSDGSPAKNAYVAAERDFELESVFHWGALTGDNGYYQIKTSAQAGTEWTVEVLRTLGNYLTVPDRYDTVLNANIVNLNFTLIQPKVITGIVRDENQQPLGDVHVEARLVNGMGSKRVYTNSEGVYYVPVFVGKFFISFYYPGYIRTTYNQKYVEWRGDTVTVSETDDTVKNIDAVLQRGGVITGTIRNGVCEGVHVWDSSLGELLFWRYLETSTYSIMVLPGTYRVMFSSERGSKVIWYNQKLSYDYADQIVVGGYPDTVRNIDVDFSILGVVEKGISPREFKLTQNYPNPFNPSTTFEFSIPANGKVRFYVTNILGQEVAVLFDGVGNAGINYQVKFDGSGLTSGVYFARLEFGGKCLTKKILLVK